MRFFHGFTVHRTSNNRQIVSPWFFLPNHQTRTNRFTRNFWQKHQTQTNRFTLNFYSQTAKPIKPSNTDKSFHPELLKTKNPYFNKCPKNLVLAFKKHPFRTRVKSTIFRATDPKTLKEMTPYRIKTWICPAICIWTVWHQKYGLLTFLSRWWRT